MKRKNVGVELSTERTEVRPWMLFGGVLAVILITEYVIMCVLPRVLDKGVPTEALASFDALVLTLILSPLAWWLVVRPQQRENKLRAEFIGDLIARIEDERRRIAHDLHDGVGQSLTLLISGLRTRSTQTDAATLQARDSELLSFAQRALADVRELSQQLRPSLLDHLGLVVAVEQTIAETERNHPIKIKLTTRGPLADRLPEAIETALFRILQESLSNVVRHASATQVSVLLEREANDIRLEISDDGCGLSDDTSAHVAGGLGVRGMRERAARLGGEFSIASGSDRGTIVRVSVPLSANHT